MPSTGDLSRLLSSERLTTTRLADDSGVLLDTTTLQVLSVNETGQVLVEALQSGASTGEELTARLVEELDVDDASARHDVDAFLEELRRLLADAS